LIPSLHHPIPLTLTPTCPIWTAPNPTRSQTRLFIRDVFPPLRHDAEAAPTPGLLSAMLSANLHHHLRGTKIIVAAANRPLTAVAMVETARRLLCHHVVESVRLSQHFLDCGMCIQGPMCLSRETETMGTTDGGIVLEISIGGLHPRQGGMIEPGMNHHAGGERTLGIEVMIAGGKHIYFSKIPAAGYAL